MGGKLKIPKITDERLAEVSALIRPVCRPDGKTLHFMQPCDLRGVSFIWAAQPAEVAADLAHRGVIRTLHTFGHPALFKPSIAEVIAQIPSYNIDAVSAFETIGPLDADALNAEREALNAGFHVATTLLYEHLVPARRSLRNALSARKGYGACYACGDSWDWKPGHTTHFEESRGIFPLCEQCWRSKSIEDRLPHYEDWASRYEPSLWPAIEKAVLEGK